MRGVLWEQSDFNKFSPHRYAANFKTPNLIIHNELDFRMPIACGLTRSNQACCVMLG